MIQMVAGRWVPLKILKSIKMNAYATHKINLCKKLEISFPNQFHTTQNFEMFRCLLRINGNTYFKCCIYDLILTYAIYIFNLLKDGV